MTMPARHFPHTIDEAVRLLMKLLDAEELASIGALPEERLIDEHMGVALFIRNAFGLWRDNPALLAATGSPHPDDASFIILRALRQSLSDAARARAPH